MWSYFTGRRCYSDRRATIKLTKKKSKVNPANRYHLNLTIFPLLRWYSLALFAARAALSDGRAGDLRVAERSSGAGALGSMVGHVALGAGAAGGGALAGVAAAPVDARLFGSAVVVGAAAGQTEPTLADLTGTTLRVRAADGLADAAHAPLVVQTSRVTAVGGGGQSDETTKEQPKLRDCSYWKSQ